MQIRRRQSPEVGYKHQFKKKSNLNQKNGNMEIDLEIE